MNKWADKKDIWTFSQVKELLRYGITIEYLAGGNLVAKFFSWKSITLEFRDLISYSPYFLLSNFYDVYLENLVMEQLNIHELIFLFIPITSRLDIVLIFSLRCWWSTVLGVDRKTADHQQRRLFVIVRKHFSIGYSWEVKGWTKLRKFSLTKLQRPKSVKVTGD